MRVVLYDATTTGDGYLAQNAAITDKLQLTFQLTGLESFDPTVTTTTVTSGTVTTTTVNVNGAYDTNGKGGSYNSGKGGSSSAPTSTSTPTQTADLSVGAIVVGAVAAVSLAGAAFTVTRRKKK